MLLRIRSAVIIVLTVLLAFIIQTTILSGISLAGIKPNLMLIMTASYGFLLGDRPGIFIGVLCGLLSDIFFGPLIGFTGMLYALIGYLCGKFRNVLYVEDLGFPLAMIGVSDFVYGFLYYFFLFLFRNRLALGLFMRQIILPEVVYTVLLGVPVYPLLSLLYDRVLRIRPTNGGHSIRSLTGQ